MNPVDWAFRQDISATQKTLLVGLAWLADDQGVTFKGQNTIAERLGEDARWVRRYLSTLGDAGLITRYRRHRLNGSRTSDLIVLNLPRDAALDLTNYSGLLGDREAGDRPTGENVSDLPANIGRPTGENAPGHTNQPPDQPVGEDTPRSTAVSDEQRTVSDLFEHWQLRCNHPTSKPTRERRQKVAARLREGYTPDQIRAAIDGAARAPFINDAGKRFDDLELICRTGSKLESFIDRSAPPLASSGPNVHPIRQTRNGPPTNGDILRAIEARQAAALNTIEGTARDAR